MNPPKTDAELTERLHAFVTGLMQHFHPHGMPLTHKAQVAFVQSTLYTARELHDSEPFLRAQVVAAAAKLKATVRK